MFEDNGNKCGKCQNHDYEVLKKGHARDCPFKKCECLKCRLLDARSDILQVISGKQTKLKGTKKDPNCGFCQNHGVKILRKGHVRSCGFGQERHFRLDNCFSCEVHYIRNEVNRLQIKMRRAMKEDRTLSEEQRKTAREAITRDEVEKVCEMARLARRKRGALVPAQQAGGESSTSNMATPWAAHCSYSPSPSASLVLVKDERRTPTFGGATPLGVGPLRAQKCRRARKQPVKQQHQPCADDNHAVASSASVWRPWSQQQQQIVAAIAAQQQQQSIQQAQQQQHHQNQQNIQQVHLPLAHQHPHQQQQFMHQHHGVRGAVGDHEAQIGRGIFASVLPMDSSNDQSLGNSGGNQLNRLLSQQNYNQQQQQHLQTISNLNLPLVAQSPQQQRPFNLQCDNSQLAGQGAAGEVGRVAGGGPLALPPPLPPPSKPPSHSRAQTPHQAGAHSAGPLGGLFNSAAAMLQSNMLLNSALHQHQHHQQHQHQHHQQQQEQRQYEHKALVPVESQRFVESPNELQLDILSSPEPTCLSGNRSGQHSRSPSVRSLSPVSDSANMSIHITCAPITQIAQSVNQFQTPDDQSEPMMQRSVQEQQVFNTLFRLLVAQFSQQTRRPQ